MVCARARLLTAWVAVLSWWAVAALTTSSNDHIKVVLIAGSKGYDNYRHQADVCHAYQLLRENGIPKENIIVMMYNDIANNTDNPQPGVIINQPGGPNVYNGIIIDYSGKDVTKKNFFNVLNGNKSAMRGIGSGRVLESGTEDNVFINFVDHGGPGVLLLPEEEIMASEFIGVLKQLSANSRFAKMFLFIEACESGSMFDDLLPDDLNIFVITAADPHESSYACFYDEDLSTYLADVFSIQWMTNSESVDLKKETINHQFQKVRTATNTSHVEEYGDIDIGVTKANEVLGYRKITGKSYSLNINDAVPSRHVPIAILGQRIKLAKTQEEKYDLRRKLQKLLQGRKYIEDIFLSLLRHAVSNSTDNSLLMTAVAVYRPSLTKSNVDCFEKSVTLLSEKCFSISKNPYVTSHLHKIINLCNTVPEESVLLAISSVCNTDTTKLQGVA